MQLIEWEVNEDDYQEQIVIPEAQRELAATAGISTENKQRVATRVQNLIRKKSEFALFVMPGLTRYPVFSSSSGLRPSPE